VRVARADLQTSRNATAAALLATGLLALSVGFVFSRRLASSLRAMKAVVRTTATGNLSARVALVGTDELAEMAADIDAMIESLDRSRREVEAHALAPVASEKKARAANEAKSVFLSSMSHELRTPLNVILGYAQMLLRVREREREDRRELEHIVEAGRHLLGLIDDVLSISKVEVGTLSLRSRPFSPATLVQAVADMLSARAQAKGLAFDVACDPKAPRNVLGDEGKLRQVLVNPIGNAIKFTAKGRVGVGVGYDADELTVRITDTGPGIAAEEQERLFETFYQGAAGRASAMGTGLGLYISQTLVRLMGGEIAVESKLDRVLSNLVDNAIKFTPAGGAVRVTWGIESGLGVESGLRFAVVTVTDSGPGIAPEELPYIFDPYRQAPTARDRGGFGLGLSVVQRVIAEHGGRVQVRSQLGVGTEFRVLLTL